MLVHGGENVGAFSIIKNLLKEYTKRILSARARA